MNNKQKEDLSKKVQKRGASTSIKAEMKRIQIHLWIKM